MTHQQAKAIYRLTGQPDYAHVYEYYQNLLKQLDQQLRTCNERDLKFLQGQAEMIERTLAMRQTAHTILEAESASTI